MKNPLLVKLGERIRSLRKTKGFSQEALSWEAELHPTYLAQIERGEVNPSFNVLYRITNALQVTFSEFFYFFEKEGIPKEEGLTNLRCIGLLSGRNKKTIMLFEEILTSIIKWTEKANKGF